MEIATKIDMLVGIYKVYDDFSKNLTMACKRGCATCCTENVTMTTLEGYCILKHLLSKEKTDLLHAFHGTAQRGRFQPTLSTNELAALCLRGEDPPEEDNDGSGAACPFLRHSECAIYPWRPFGCRCFFSTEVCASVAYAVVSPFLLTVNTVFLQFIEHIDTGGLFGNMNDVLRFLGSETRCSYYETYATVNSLDRLDGLGGIARNMAIPALLVPPEHQQRLKPILEELGKIGMQHARFEKKENLRTYMGSQGGRKTG